MKQDRFFYGWVIVAVSFVNMAFTLGIWYSFSVFFVAVIEEFHWSRAVTSGVFSCFMIVHSLSAVLVGSILDRFGPRRVLPTASCIVALGLVASSRISHLWEFYLWYGVMTAMGICALGFIAHGMILPKWFERKRGLATGIAMAGIGLGMQVIVPATQYLINIFGWRPAYLVLAAVVLLVLFPLNALLQKKDPGEVGEVPDGSRSIRGEEKKKNETYRPPAPPVADTLFGALHTRQFWFLFFSFFFVPMAVQGTLIHQVARVVDTGFSAARGAFFFGLAGIMGSVGKIFFGSLSDIIGREKAFAMGMVCAMLGVASLLFLESNRSYLLYSYAILFGLGYGSVAPLFPAKMADLFLGPHFGKIYGILSLAGGVGGALGVFLSGKIFDLTNDYTTAFILGLTAITLAIILFSRAAPKGGKIDKSGSAPLGRHNDDPL